MKSPRFDIRAAVLENIFSPNNIKFIWTKKVRVFMRQQFMNDGIENFDFHTFRDIECDKLSEKILSGGYVPQTAQRILVEKSKGLCRQIVIPSVRDAIVLQCLSDHLYPSIKKNAPSKNSFFEPKEHKFSSQRDSYGTFASWLKFQKELFSFSKERNFIVVTDIANYYDTINYVHLRNTLSPNSGADECVLDMLVYVLSDLLWQPDYTPRFEIGLPQINLDAPRVLAHCFLYELDSYLESDKNVDFVRYMDDIDVGVDDIVKAKQILKDVDLILQTKHVRLNSGKTRILTKTEALHHFRIRDNLRLDMLNRLIDRKLKDKKNIEREKRFIELKISRGLKDSHFDDGNGDKILKRFLTLASKTKAYVSPSIIEQIIKLRPNCRENILAYVRSRPLIPSVATALAKSIQSGLLIDDASIIDIANYIAETKVKSKWKLPGLIDEILIGCNKNSIIGLYSILWIASKYKDVDYMFSLIDKKRNVWMPDDRLSRVVASFRPIFKNSTIESDYVKLVEISNNNGAHDVFRFHDRLSSDPDIFASMYDALKNPNRSRGTGITHAKFLCLLSALMNSAVPPAKKEKLIELNATALSDAFYQQTAKRLKLI